MSGWSSPRPAGGGRRCLGPDHGRPGPPPVRAGRRRGYRQSPGSWGGLRPKSGDFGPGCLGPGRGRPAPPPVAQVDGEVIGGSQGVRVVFAQDPATSVEAVLVQLAGGLHLPQRTQVDARLLAGPGCRGGPRPGPGACGPGCLGPARGRPALPPAHAGRGEVAGGAQGAGWSSPGPGAAVEGVLVQVAGGLGLPQPAQVSGEVDGGGQGVGWSSPRIRRVRSRVSWSRSRASA